MLVQKIYTQFKRTPATHKLGVLYVVDSVTRQWIEKATAAGEKLTGGSSNADGTFAAGVQRMTDLLPLLVKDVITTAPEDQKVCTSQKSPLSPICRARPAQRHNVASIHPFLATGACHIKDMPCSRDVKLVGQNHQTRRHLGSG